LAQVAVFATGTLAYVVGGQVPDLGRRLVWVDRRGHVDPLSVPPKPYYVPRLSPDGSLLAVQTLQSERRIWVHDLRVPGSLMPVTNPDLAAWHPVWTGNGERLAFSGSPNGRSGLFWTRADGTQPAEQLVSSGTLLAPASWTPDGRLLYMRADPKAFLDVWLLSREGDT
jgi:Tol biopolymer transport system component